MQDLNPVPLYFRLKEKLKHKIEGGEYHENEPIPSENKLIDQYGVSRTTVRKAIDTLIQEGYLYSVQGRGTFVKSKFSQGLVRLTSCTEDIRNKGMNPSVKVLGSQIIEPNEKVKERLQLDDNHEKVFMLERIMYADNTPINKTKSFVTYNYVNGIDKYDFSIESLYKIIEKQYEMSIKHAVRTIEAKLSNELIAEHLEVGVNEPMLYFEGVVFAESNGKEIPIEYFETMYRSDKWKFYIEQIR